MKEAERIKRADVMPICIAGRNEDTRLSKQTEYSVAGSNMVCDRA